MVEGYGMGEDIDAGPPCRGWKSMGDKGNKGQGARVPNNRIGKEISAQVVEEKNVYGLWYEVISV